MVIGVYKCQMKAIHGIMLSGKFHTLSYFDSACQTAAQLSAVNPAGSSVSDYKAADIEQL